jgi:hypothetical protein
MQYLDFVGRDSFYGFLAEHGHELFGDEDFAALYCADNGRRSVPPSLLAVALLLQTHDRVSDDEAKRRADFDLQWKVALGIEIDERPFAKSTANAARKVRRCWWRSKTEAPGTLPWERSRVVEARGVGSAPGGTRGVYRYAVVGVNPPPGAAPGREQASGDA